MANFNKVFLIGRLTQDPELRYTASGVAVTDLRLAINRSYNTKDGERRDDTLFIDVTAWNRTAEICCQYLARGRQVHVEGHLKMDSWDDRNTGEKRTKIKVEADQVQFLDGRRDDAGGSMPSRDEDEYAPSPMGSRRSAPEPPSRGPASVAPPRPAGPGPRRAPAPPPEMDPEDDIPF